MRDGADFIADVARALGFLGRLPVPAHFFEGHDGSMRRVSGSFAIAGALIAIAPALLLGLLLHGEVSVELACLLAITLQIGMTGALHEDGLADCADGFGGARSRDRMLEIMKDSRLGAYGGLALILSIGLRTFALAALAAETGPLAAALALVATHAAARAALVWHWHVLPPARADGVAAAVGQPDAGALRLALASGVLIYAVCTIPFLGFAPALGGAAAGLLVTFLFTRLTRGKIQGHTGDTLGASEQLAEIGILIGLAIAT